MTEQLLQMGTQVLVIGGGYGGVTFARRLAAERLDVAITLIDKNPYHTMLTEVHQVAAGHRAPDTVRFPFSEMEGFQFIQAEVTGIDAGQRQVQTTAGIIPYDYLVVALGSVDTDYGIPGVREHTMTLHSVGDALAIRDRLAALPEEAPIVVAGGGLTGVELAAELGLRRAGGNLTLVEGAPTLLPGMDRKLQRSARRRLGALGVNVMTGARIARVEPGMVHFQDGSALPFGLMVWACGVKANPLIAQLGIPTDRAGRALVDANLQTELPGVYVIGDCAAGAPPTAQVARQHGEELAAHLAGLITGRPHPVHPARLKGTLVDLGHTFGVGDVGSLKLTGWVPALLKRTNVARWVWTAADLPAATRYFLGLD